MREIEIKARVPDEATLVARLADQNVQLSDPVTQYDLVYGQPGVAANTPGSRWLRVRVEDNSSATLNFKQPRGSGLDKIEHETRVSNPAATIEIITALGFVAYSELRKSRQTAQYGDVTICVDNVEELGTFVEVERLIDDDEIAGETVVGELWLILEAFGVDRTLEIHDGYDVMKNNLNSLSASEPDGPHASSPSP